MKCDKLKQWVNDRALKEDVQGSMLGRKESFFPCLIVPVLWIMHIYPLHER